MPGQKERRGGVCNILWGQRKPCFFRSKSCSARGHPDYALFTETNKNNNRIMELEGADEAIKSNTLFSAGIYANVF